MRGVMVQISGSNIIRASNDFVVFIRRGGHGGIIISFQGFKQYWVLW
jgi:hypothetical protein